VPIVFGTNQQASATATLSQLIFDGSYLVGLEAAKTFLQYSNDVEEKTQLQVRKGVINAYGSVLISQESVKILKNNLETLEKNYEETKKIFDNGLTEEENVEQLQI
ncbi:TolC family protein, partial [Aquimarina celericrescens]|nr:TolC family protein [Aquimarina celericrescens]